MVAEFDEVVAFSLLPLICHIMDLNELNPSLTCRSRLALAQTMDMASAPDPFVVCRECDRPQ